MNADTGDEEEVEEFLDGLGQPCEKMLKRYLESLSGFFTIFWAIFYFLAQVHPDGGGEGLLGTVQDDVYWLGI